MAEDAIDIVQRAYAALNRRDVEGALRFFDPDIDWHMSTAFARAPRVFHGHDGIREVVALFDEALDGFRVEPRALHDGGGDKVLAEVTASGFVRGTGDATSYDIVNAWELRDGCAVAVRAYPTLEDAWRAEGMTAPAPSSASISAPGTGRENR